MMHIYKFSISLLAVVFFSSVHLMAQKPIVVTSPNQSLKANIVVSDAIQFSVFVDNNLIVSLPNLSVVLGSGEILGYKPVVSKVENCEVNSTIQPINYKKNSIIERYNETIIRFRDGYQLIMRAYNDGIAYRFVIDRNDSLIVVDEPIQFNFAKNYDAWVPYSTGKTNKFASAYQNEYHKTTISEIKSGELAFLPVLFDINNGAKLCFTEVDIFGYPGMFLESDLHNGLKSRFAPYPMTETEARGRCQLRVEKYETFIAKIAGKHALPWRLFGISKEDIELLQSDLVYALGAPNKIGDASWVKPGKIAWDWWNDWGISGVDFKVGINTETYKYYTDFAAENRLEYVVLDEGWSPPAKGDIFEVIPDIDLDAIVKHADEKGVGIILWAVWNVIDKHAEDACKFYAQKGIKGFKIDFIDRNDQKAVEFASRFAEIAAKYKLIVDYHGMYQPAGLQRTYPNILNYEGVFGLEELKWSNPDMPLYNTTFPFIRMYAGPVDYTPGAMRNASKKCFRDIYAEPMSQGTRCHQMALYVLLDAPLTTLADNPVNYRAAQECTSFMAAVPTTWDKTIGLQGEVGRYIVTARQKEEKWYVAGISNWDKRDLTIDFSFLPKGSYNATLFSDGLNANNVATDYKRTVISLTSETKLLVKLASGGGFIMKIEANGEKQ